MYMLGYMNWLTMWCDRCLLKDKQDRMQTGTVTHTVVRSCAKRAWMVFFSTDLISYLHMRTMCCWETDGQNCEGMLAGFPSKIQTCGDIYARVSGNWAAVTFKNKSVPSTRARWSKKVGLIGCPKMLLTNYQPTLATFQRTKFSTTLPWKPKICHG